MGLLTKVILCFGLIALVLSQAATTPIQAIGTVLPRFTPNGVNPFRAFTDLMKQSLPLVPYQLTSWGGIGRCWSSNCKLNFTKGLPHLYPANLTQFIWAVAQIPFLPKNDQNLSNQTYNIKFTGNGIIGVTQTNLYNLTFLSYSNGGNNSGKFLLPTISQSLFVYIYNTDPNDPVRNISIVRADLGSSYPTFTETFLEYLRPFNLFRTCYWQGQNLYNSGLSLQVWENRTLVESSTQISSSGVALQHIFQLQKSTNGTVWLCIPDTADSSYITQMSLLTLSLHTPSTPLYLQYGNAYTTMNDIPDIKTNPAFTTWMQAYGSQNRNKILFTINYKDVQYYINAMGMRTSPVNWTYIDAIGFQGNFGVVDIGGVWGGGVEEVKGYLTNMMLSYEVTVNKAYQIAKMNGTNLITYSSGPYIKTPRYAYIWRNQTNSSYSANATIQQNLATTLNSMNLNDEWVGQFYLQWIGRLKSMGMKSIVFCEVVGGAWTLNTDIVPFVTFFNTTTPAYRAVKGYVAGSRVGILPLSGVVPPNPFDCSATGCVWGDCIKNICECYIGYSGPNCSTYTAPKTQQSLGINLQSLSYWSTQNPFIDMQKTSSDWVYFLINGGWSSGDAYKSQVKFDTNGYPTYLPPGIAVGTLIARDVQTHYDPGNYTVLYDGDGVLSFGMYDVKGVVYGVGRCVIRVEPSTNMNNGIFIRIDRTNPKDYIRNIRVIRPGFQDKWWGQKFSPLLLEKLAPFATLRFMDWTNTNGQTDVNWQDRVLPTHRTYTKNGAAWQQPIHLSNLLHKNLWINIPHLATPTYITQLATLVLQKLQPHLKVYIQYSNQVWGTLFPGGKYAQNQGVKYYGNVISDPTQARFCWYAMITGNVSGIWKGVWGAEKGRVKVVASTQAVNPDTTKRILACENLYSKIDMVAIAPYLDTPLTDTTTSSQLFQTLTQKLPTLLSTLQSHLSITNSYSPPIPLSCYESGQGLLGSTALTTTLQIGAQNDDRMRILYVKYLEMLYNCSMELVCLYGDTGRWTGYGSWGMFQFGDQGLGASAKWNGTMEYMIQQNYSIAKNTFGTCTQNCNNNGICSFNQCICYGDYTGPDCSIAKYIDYIQCGYLCTFNQGVCVLNSIVGNNRYFSCVCNPGYTGAYCAIAICAGNCSYSGTCTAPNVCSCLRGRMGAKCQTDCGCGGHGICNPNTTCTCDPGYFFNTTSKKCQYECYGQPSTNCYGPNLLACTVTGCVGGTCRNGTCVCWPGYTGGNCSVEIKVDFGNGSLGINLGGLSYWSTQHMFKDYFKQSSQWIPQYYPGYFNSSIAYTWNTSQFFPTLPNGYPSSLTPNQTTSKLLLRDLNLHYPSYPSTNQYILLYEGEGIIKLGFDATVYENSAGRIRFRVVPSVVRDNGVLVQLLMTNPGNPVRNVRVVLERDQYGFQGDLVTEEFLEFVGEFTTIRFMDLLGTNGSPVSQWNQTTRPDQDTQAQPTGISIELLTKITQRTGRNPWINIPHLASDNYVQTLAQYLKANISSTKTIYIEYSNQVWNTFFAQGKYAVSQAAALGLANSHKFYAKRSLEIFKIFQGVFGVGSPRVKFVVSYQAVSKWVADQILNGTGLIGVAHILANAPYYDCNSIGNTTNTALYATLTPTDILTKCNISLPSLDSTFTISTNLSQTYNLPLSTYQSGTSISQTQTIYSGSQNPSATANFIAANRAEGMYQIYKKLLYKYKENGYMGKDVTGAVVPLMLFSSVGLPSKYGSWGLMDYMGQVGEDGMHPKFRAVVDFNRGV